MQDKIQSSDIPADVVLTNLEILKVQESKETKVQKQLILRWHQDLKKVERSISWSTWSCQVVMTDWQRTWHVYFVRFRFRDDLETYSW